MTEEKQSFQRGAVILLCSAVLVKLIGALFKIPLASEWCLGDLGFGYFSSVYDLFGPIYSVAMAGFPVALARLVSEREAAGNREEATAYFQTAQRAFSRIGAAGMAFIVLAAFPAVRLFHREAGSVYILFALAPAAFFCAAMSSYRGYYQGRGSMTATAVSEVIEALGKLLLGFSLAFWIVRETGSVMWGAVGAMGGITAGTALAFGYLKFYNRRRGDRPRVSSPLHQGERERVQTLLLLALPVTLAALSNNMAPMIDALTAEWRVSDALLQDGAAIRRGLAMAGLPDGQIPAVLYGLRSKAYTIYNLVPTFTAVLSVSAVPVIARFAAQGNGEEVRRNTDTVLKFSAVISLPAAAGLITTAPGIMAFLFDSKASVPVGAPLLRVYGIAAAFAGIVIPMTGILQAVGKQGKALVNIAIGAAVKLGINLILIGRPQVNIMGAAIGTAVCYGVIFCLHFRGIVQAMGAWPDLIGDFFKPLIAAAACGAVAYLIFRGGGKIQLLGAIAAAAAVYVVLLFVLRCFTKSDFSTVPGGKQIVKFCVKYRIFR